MACAGLKFLDGQLPENIKSIPQTKRGLNFALEVMRIASEFTYRAGKTFQMKIGIHYGNCIYGLLGYHKPQFSLIGDTINTTSRHCTTGKAGYIIMSEAAFQQLDSNIRSSSSFEIKDIFMKGKGTVHTYCLNICGETTTKTQMASIGTLLKGRLTGLEVPKGGILNPADSSVNLPMQLPMMVANYVKDTMTFGRGVNPLDLSANSRGSAKLEKAEMESEPSMDDAAGAHIQSPLHADTPKMDKSQKQSLFLNLESPIQHTRQLAIPSVKKSDRRIAVNPKSSMIEAVAAEDLFGLFDNLPITRPLSSAQQLAKFDSMVPETPMPGSVESNPSPHQSARVPQLPKWNVQHITDANLPRDDSQSQGKLEGAQVQDPIKPNNFSLAIKKVEKEGPDSSRNGKSEGTPKPQDNYKEFMEEVYDEDDEGEDQQDYEEEEDEFKEETSGMFGFANTPKSFFSNYQSEYSQFDSLEQQYADPKSGSFSKLNKFQIGTDEAVSSKPEGGQSAIRKSNTLHYSKKDGIDSNNPNEFESRSNYQQQSGTSKVGLWAEMSRIIHPFPVSKPNLLPMYYCKMASMYGSTFRLAVILKLILLFVNITFELSKLREYTRNAESWGNMQNYISFGVRITIGLVYSILLVPGFVERWARSVKFMVLFNLYTEFSLDLLPCIWL